jgi:peptidoglycan/LPS O-acetylase OafA/YrhL
MHAPRHIPALDGLRALAILLVIPHNLDMLGAPVPLFLYPVAALMHAGWIGVQLFFVLSGFLITGNLLDARGADNYFAAFFGRRALRILPLYFGVLCVTFLIAPLWFTVPAQLHATAPHQIWLWTFLSNWTEPFDGGVFGFGHFWSLAVEEQFYLLWPFVVVRCSPRALLWVCAASVAVALVVRIALLAAHLPNEAVYMFTLCRMDALALGAAAAAILRMPATQQRLAQASSRIAIGALVILLVTAAATRAFAIYDVSTQSVGYSVLALGFALIVLLAALPSGAIVGGSMRVLAWKPLRLVGRYSYGMYVMHMPLHVFFTGPLLRRWYPDTTPLIAVAYVGVMTVATFLLAAVSYEGFERRFLQMKRRFTPTVAASSA